MSESCTTAASLARSGIGTSRLHGLHTLPQLMLQPGDLRAVTLFGFDDYFFLILNFCLPLDEVAINSRVEIPQQVHTLVSFLPSSLGYLTLPL